MLLARVLDDKFAALYRAGKIHGGVFLGPRPGSLERRRRVSC
jgi:TPP-dependent pyruvate/acetoin dehydrogenase alpha subunit